MPRTLPPVQAIRTEIDARFPCDRDLVEVIEDVARPAARPIIQTAVEAEVEAFLRPRPLPSRRHHLRRPQRRDEGAAWSPQRALPDHRQDQQRADHHRPPAAARHHREVRLPPVRHRRQPHPHAGRSSSSPSRAACPRVTSKTRWPTRSAQKPRCPSPRPRPSARPSSPSTTPGAAATGIELDYLFCDASHFNMHDGSRAEPILAAWGITAPSKPVFISPARRRLGVHRRLARLPHQPDRSRPAPAATPRLRGAPGLISAAEQTFPSSLHQRCLPHRARTELAKANAADQPAAKAAYGQNFYLSSLSDDIKPGQHLND